MEEVKPVILKEDERENWILSKTTAFGFLGLSGFQCKEHGNQIISKSMFWIKTLR